MAADMEQLFVKQYAEQVERTGTPEGASDWYADQAKGNYGWLAGIWQLCVNTSALQRWNMKLFRVRGMVEAEVMEQKKLAEAAMDIARAYMGQHYGTL
eukprot:5739997-Amphidinium_carterae.1